MTADELKDLIRLAFPAEPRPRPHEITDPGDKYWERLELRRDLKGKSWPEVPIALLRRDSGGELTWASATGFRYYLPAWMVAALEDGTVLFGVLGALGGHEGQESGDRHAFLLGHISALDSRQTAAIVTFLEYICEQPEGGHFQKYDKEDAARALVFWRERAQQSS